MGQTCWLLSWLGVLMVWTLAAALEKRVVQEVSRTELPHVVTFFIERCDNRPICMPEKVITDMRSGKLDHAILGYHLRSRGLSGIYATYMGAVATSDNNGQISFLKKHLSDRVTFIVTRSLQPVLSGQATVHHFIISPYEPAAYYQMERKPFAQKNKPTWTVRKIETPKDRVVPVSAVVLIADPDQIVVPQESFVVSKSPNLLLPTVYALPTLTPGINAIHFLQVNRYFAPNIYAWRFAKTRYATMIVP